MQKLIRKLPKYFANCKLRTTSLNPDICFPGLDIIPLLIIGALLGTNIYLIMHPTLEMFYRALGSICEDQVRAQSSI